MASDLDIDSVLSQLSLDEKIKLISGIDFWHTAKIERLGVPSLRFSDGPNGVRGTKFFNGVPAGCFPCGTALGATFSKELLEEAGALMAKEAKAKAASVILGPTTNIARGPNGGRGFESFSEDPILNGLSGAAVIKGIQDNGIAATIKHFVCNDLEDNRNGVNSIVSPRALREIYLLPFQLAVRDSQPAAFMTAYNLVNGEHCSQSKFLLDDVLRKEWGFDGTVMSDWFGVYDSKSSIKGGLDIEMPGPPACRVPSTVTLGVKTGEIHINELNARVRNVLKLVKWCGRSGVKETDPETASNNTPETAALLRKIGRESIVLLKNEKEGLLPLKPTEKIAVIGQNAKYAAYCGGGSASLYAYYTTTPFEGISSKLDYDPAYALGCQTYKNLPALGDKLVRPDGSKGYTIKVYGTEEADGELIETLDLTTSYMLLFDYLHPKIKNDYFFFHIEGKLTPEEDGTYIFGLSVSGTAQLFVDGKLVVDNKTKQTVGQSFFGSGTIEQTGTIDLKAGQTYDVKIVFGSAPTMTVRNEHAQVLQGAGGLQFGFDRVISAEEEILKAVEVAKQNDKVVLCVGLNQEFESEGFDRPHLKLPGLTDRLVEEVLKANPNTVIVNQTGTPVEMPWADKAPAVLQAWFGGNEGGNAIADVLFGDYNPSGKLSLSFPLRFQDNPAYLNFKSNNNQCLYGEDVYIGHRYYEAIDRPVLFPFGHGLSYTSFELSDFSVKKTESDIKVSLKVSNVGKIDGAEVVQVYVAPTAPAITRPPKELKDYTKVFVPAGESKTVEISVPLKYATAYFDAYQEQWCCQADKYEILVGTSSDKTVSAGSIEIEKTFFWSGV
ncbi:unnamed protein product [Kuraishia capsulata CBS 1993]|uniref:beta-glucosidase n=1 Tax=Kuraishia capsulata CBS 1993 TaxID=1382522 RepID=W6MXF0_9ASCO|nr:uncharacterized protein KUCA_T00004760001 [Kuraishia capsulata CBS 1993]CDK28775.1 unnamed protein product [Kuraishia capsulata CBS 1993]